MNLIEIVERTPNIEHLSVTFGINFDSRYRRENYPSSRVKSMTTNFCCLSKLINLSISTKSPNCPRGNERLPFNQIQLFIDQCCPNKTILKKSHSEIGLYHVL